MEWFEQTIIIVGMFVVRLGVPLLITLAVGYWLRRLDEKWQAEALARQTAEAPAVVEPEPNFTLYKVIDRPCWEVKGCPAALSQQCPAFEQPGRPCWQARYQAEGRLPATCYSCPIFARRSASQSQIQMN
ncbi:MAG: hypothetical protein KDF65_07030 [Anaerolineae bacterium]|nr:hypothetical protein [Anaerolineae bacterium]